MLEAFVQALLSLGDLQLLIFMVAGVLVGLIFGIIPGIGGMLALSLFLPFAFKMEAEQALPFMLAVMSVTGTGGAITAILTSVPGVPTSAATVLDGFPMTQKGEGGRALGAALTAGGAAGFVSAILALAMIPAVLPLVMAINSADMVFIVLAGLSFIAVLSKGSMAKGLISAGIGLLISFIGYQPMSAADRFTFGSIYLYDGVPLVPVALGLFGVPIMVSFAARGGTIAGAGVVIKGMEGVWEGSKDVFRHWWLFIRCTIIGYIIGVIPGIGSETAIWVSYGQAKQTSKHPEKFGTGVVEGVIAPESASSAKEGGAALTTFALGIPGSAIMALVLGGLMMVGLTPGPEMLRNHLSLSLSLLYVIAAANILGTVICWPIAPTLAKIAAIPDRILVPLILTIMLTGTFAYQGRMLDIIVLLVFGGLGLAIKAFNYNAPAMFLGYILGSLFEYYFFIAFVVAGPLFFLRPISLSLIVVIIALLTYGPISGILKRRFSKARQA